MNALYLVSAVSLVLLAHQAQGRSIDEPRIIDCSGAATTLKLHQIDNDDDATTPLIWRLQFRYVDYETSVDQPVFLPSPHGLAFSQRLAADNDGTVENVSIFMTPQVLMGPTSSAIFESAAIFSRRYLYLDTTPTHTEVIKLRCSDSAPWQGGETKRGSVVRVLPHAVVIRMESGDDVVMREGLFPAIVTMGRGIEGGLDLLQVDRTIQAVLNSNDDLVKIYVY